MPTSELVRQATGDAELEQALGHQIERRTEGRVGRPYIAVRPEGIVVAGTAPSYYLKQLILEAVLDVTRTRAARPVALRIRVAQHSGATIESQG